MLTLGRARFPNLRALNYNRKDNMPNMTHDEAIRVDATALAGAVTMFSALTGIPPVELLTSRRQEDPTGFSQMVDEHYAESTGEPFAPPNADDEVFEQAIALLSDDGEGA